MQNQFIKQIRQRIKHWYVPLIVGLILIATAIWTFISPVESFVALSILFSISFLSSGLLEIYFALVNREEIENWGWSLAFGVLSAVIGVLLLINPEISLVTLPFYVGFTVLFRSISAIAWSVDMKRYGILDWANLMVIGVLGLIFSFILLWNPIFAGFTIVFWAGLTLFLSGLFSVFFSVKLRKLNQRLSK